MSRDIILWRIDLQFSHQVTQMAEEALKKMLGDTTKYRNVYEGL
jgi:hypothetical protein